MKYFPSKSKKPGKLFVLRISDNPDIEEAVGKMIEQFPTCACLIIGDCAGFDVLDMEPQSAMGAIPRTDPEEHDPDAWKKS
jgi:hypothetical protein